MKPDQHHDASDTSDFENAAETTVGRVKFNFLDTVYRPYKNKRYHDV